MIAISEQSVTSYFTSSLHMDSVWVTAKCRVWQAQGNQSQAKNSLKALRILDALSVVTIGVSSSSMPILQSYVRTNSPVVAKVCGVGKWRAPSDKLAKAAELPCYCTKCIVIAA